MTWLSCRWLRQHECVEKLNMHAILSASAGQEQLLIELLVSHAKVSTGAADSAKPRPCCPASSLGLVLLRGKCTGEHTASSWAGLQGLGFSHLSGEGAHDLPFTSAVALILLTGFLLCDKAMNCAVRRDGVCCR